MAEGGAFFFLDLGAPDATYILPCAAAVTFLGVTEIGMDGMKMQVTPVMKWVFRLLPIGFLPLSADLPSACLLYWCSSNTFSMMQTLFMRNKAVKKWLMIPEVPEQVRPSRHTEITASQSCTPFPMWHIVYLSFSPSQWRSVCL
jgi:YidC/Oxa1 family membrane protein insertase